MGKKYLAAFLAAALMLNNAMTGFAAVGIAGNGKGTLANAGDAFGNRTQETKKTDSDAAQPEYEVTYSVLPEELEDMAEVDGPDHVKAGETLTFSVKPEAGAEIESVTVNGDALEGSRSLLGGESRKYKVKDVGTDCEVEITLKETEKTQAVPNVPVSAIQTKAATSSDAVCRTEAGGEDTEFMTLQEAVEKADDGAVIYVLRDFTMTKPARFFNKHLTITSDGDEPFTVTRGEDFDMQSDDNRSWYNPAMIEAGGVPDSMNSSLTLENIIFDDAGRHEGSLFMQAPVSDISSDTIVQDAIVATYNNTATITLGDGAILKNFGGMSAVRISGGELIMEDGSKIIDDSITDREKDGSTDFGPAGAVWMQGGTFEMEEGAYIGGASEDEWMVGRAVYIDGGEVTLNGTISRIEGDLDMWYGMEGAAVHVRNGGKAILGETGAIDGIRGEHNTGRGAVRTNGGESGDEYSFEAKDGSVMKNVEGISALYSNYGKELLNGTIEFCTNDYIIGGFAQNTTIGETGVIQNCTAKGGAANALVYTSNSSRVYMYGTVKDNTCSHAFYIINQSGGGAYLEMHEPAAVTGSGSGDGVYINASESKFVMNGGTISNFNYGVNCRGKLDTNGKLNKPRPATFIMNGGKLADNKTYGLYFQGISASESIVDIEGGTIEGNGSAEIYAYGGNSRNAYERLKLNAETLKGAHTVKLSLGTLTLDENYAGVMLGQARTEANGKIKELLAEKYPGWTTVGSNALWVLPSAQEFHFTMDRPSSVRKTGLFTACIPLNEDGTPAENAELRLEEIENEGVLDITMKDLTPGTPYAMIFVNNTEYTLSPDDTTIYTGGGQNNETYDDGGFPMLTLKNSLDAIKNVEINGEAVTENPEEALISLFTVNYLDENGTPVEDDTVAGEYEAHLTLKDPATKIRINGNDVSGEMEPGTLIVRHTQDISEAQDGSITYPKVEEEPAAPVEHATVVDLKYLGFLSSTYYVNNDAERKITDTSGISLLDDSLLLEEGDNRQELMEERAEKELGTPASGNGYKYEFHYLDLVDAHNGNAWVAASYGSVVYLPYPDGTDANTDFKLVHYTDLHREYGISGQAAVEEAIRNTGIEIKSAEDGTLRMTENGIRFETERAGFSPFALVWEVPAHKVTVNYFDADTKEPIPGIAPYEKNVAEGTVYDVTDEAQKPIPGYTFKEIAGVSAGTMGQEDIAVASYYTKNITPEPYQYTVTVRYLDKETGEEIHDPYVTGLLENGAEYDVTEYTEIAVEGYTRSDGELQAKGTIDNANVLIVVYYEKNAEPSPEPEVKTYTVTVRYLDQETGKDIMAAYVTGPIKDGAAYDVEEETEAAVSGYTRARVEGQAKGTIGGENVVIRVYYTKNAETPATYTITISYLEKGTGHELKAPVSLEKPAGQPYDVSGQANQAVDGYRIAGTEGEVKGDSLTGNVAIKVYYEKLASEPSYDDGDDDDSDGSGRVYTVGLSGNWVHVDPQNTNIAIRTAVPEGATPVTSPEYHQWKFILNDGTVLKNQWAYVKNPYAVDGQPKEGWFSFDAAGIMRYGWYLDTAAGKWYYLHRTSDGMLGTMIEGWHFDEQDGKWYYLKPGSGEMLTGWQYIGGKWYYLNPTPQAETWSYNEETGGWTYNGTAARPYGSMYQSEKTPDGYGVDRDGAWEP